MASSTSRPFLGELVTDALRRGASSCLLEVSGGGASAGSGQAWVLGQDVATQGSLLRARVGYMPEHD